MAKIDDLKVGDNIFSLKGDTIVKWKIISMLSRHFVVVDEEDTVTKVHWKTLEYGGDFINFFSPSKRDVVERYKDRTTYVFDTLIKLI